MKELHTGLNLTLLDAIILMIIVSDNTGTNLVIDSVGLKLSMRTSKKEDTVQQD